MGGGAGDRVDPGDHVGEVLVHRAGRRAGDAREPDHGKARRAHVPPAQGYPDDLLRRDGVLRRGREERGMTTRDSFGSRSTFKVGRRTFEIFRLAALEQRGLPVRDRKSTRLNSSHVRISYAVFCLKKKKQQLVTRRIALQKRFVRTTRTTSITFRGTLRQFHP